MVLLFFLFCSLKKGPNPKILILCLVVVNSVQPLKLKVCGSVGFNQITDSMSTGASGRVKFTQLHNQRSFDNTRNEIKHVRFSRPFATVPVVTAAFVSLDTEADANIRARAFINSVSTSGFDVRVMEWANTHNYEISVAWTACAN